MTEITCSDMVRFPFSLCCCECDAGMDIDTPEEAYLKGWTEITESDGASYNYLGLCPEHKDDPQ